MLPGMVAANHIDIITCHHDSLIESSPLIVIAELSSVISIWFIVAVTIAVIGNCHHILGENVPQVLLKLGVVTDERTILLPNLYKFTFVNLYIYKLKYLHL